MMNRPPSEEARLQRHIFRGSAWSIAIRWSVRLTGLISTVVLARLLTPADFGIVAIATLIVGSLEIFTQAGQYDAIIRHPNPTREHYDSVWTISLLLGLGLGSIIWTLTPLTTAYFHEPRVKAVVEILAIRTMLLGFQNVGIVNFVRNLNFQRQFYFNVAPELVSVVATLGSAAMLRDYWALVIGIMAQKATVVVLSYVMESYRPRICFSKVREIWSFSMWSLIRSLGAYINNQIDKVAIGGFGGAVATGRYDVARDVAISPGQELINPVISVLLPVMAKIQNDKQKRRELYLNVLYWSSLISTSAGVGVALVAEDLSDFILGAKWHDIWPLMPWFALTWGITGLTGSVSSVLLALGRPLLAARMQWTRVICYALAILPVAYFFRSLEAVIITRFLVTLVVSPTLFYVLSRVLEVPMRDFLSALSRPIMAAVVMSGGVLAFNASIGFRGPPRLFLDIGTGVTCYGVSLMALWIVRGSPEGPERAVWEWTRLRFALPWRRWVSQATDSSK